MFTFVPGLGADVGTLLGAALGDTVGLMVGARVGTDVGTLVGAALGDTVGTALGIRVGLIVGVLEGPGVGFSSHAVCPAFAFWVERQGVHTLSPSFLNIVSPSHDGQVCVVPSIFK